MACRSYDTRHLDRQEKQSLFFDQFFSGDEGFIRPVRKGQASPSVPVEILSDTGPQYLVETLDGEWVCMLTSESAADILLLVEENGGIPQWIH